MKLRSLLLFGILALAPNASRASINVFSNGEDGILNVVSSDVTIDLSKAPKLPWNAAPQVAGQGVYDPTQ